MESQATADDVLSALNQIELRAANEREMELKNRFDEYFPDCKMDTLSESFFVLSEKVAEMKRQRIEDATKMLEIGAQVRAIPR